MSNPYEDPICSHKFERRLRRHELKNGKCKYCGSPHAITKDHIHPKSRGGGSNLENLQPLCAFCNSFKADKLESELRFIFHGINERGIWYNWEIPYARYLNWLRVVCKERKHHHPFW